MNGDDEIPKLRMAPPEPLDRLEERANRERELRLRHREQSLGDGLEGFRVGSVPYLNSVPLTRGLEDQILFKPPSELARMLDEDALDAALVSVTEVLLKDRYDVLDGIAVASLGEVLSVFVAHTKPLEEVEVIHLDPASCTSVNLLKVLLAERGLKPRFEPLETYDPSAAPEAALYIGNPAIQFRQAGTGHQIWDLGAAWFELTQLPFVYAVWAIRRGRSTEALRLQLREARDFGIDTLDHIIHHHPEFDVGFRRDYLGWHIHFHLGSDERRGIEAFSRLLEKHGLGPVFPVQYLA